MTLALKDGAQRTIEEEPRRISLGRFANTKALRSCAIGISAIIAVWVSLVSAPGIVGVLGACLGLIMLAIAVIDWHSYIIPDWLTAGGILLAIVCAAVREPEAIRQAIALATLRGLALALVFFLLRYGYAKLRGCQGLGFGDVKLAFVAGSWLDWLTIPIAIELAAFAGITTYLLRLFVLRQPISATTRMPFGLFFAPAIWICWAVEMNWADLP
jgi:leader peptidase (prepilin peptidase) / N-methyltransferase